MENSKLSSELVTIVQQASLSRLKSLSGRQSISIELINEAPLVCAHWMSLILISGKSLRATFKAHFMTSAAQFFACKAYDMNQTEVSQSRAHDFFREFCNLTAGHTKLVLDANQVKVGVSLPALARGFDDVFYPRDGLGVVRYWHLRCEDVSLTCSVHFDIYESMEIVTLETEHDKNVGSVDFL